MKFTIPLSFALVLLILIFSCKKEQIVVDNDDEKPVITDTTTTDTTVVIDCNGHPSLCDSNYNRLTFVMPHNAHAYTPVYSAFAANQERDVATQLVDGVRAFTFKTYYTDDAACGAQDVYVYHGFATLGCEPFSKVLGQISTFMEANPHEVITIGIEGSAGVSEMEQSFIDADLTKFFHVQPFGQPWPTLREMIDSNKRLVVFAARGNTDQVDGFHDYWNFIVDNDYQAEKLSDFDCEWFRGNENGGLYLFNHFITILTPQRDSAAKINSYVPFRNRINDCMQYHGRKPNFLHVDFYNLGACLQIADELNGVN